MISMPIDKQAHFLGGMAICAMFTPFGLGIAFAVAFGVALLKEGYDHFFGGTVDPYHLAAVCLTVGQDVTADFFGSRA